MARVAACIVAASLLVGCEGVPELNFPDAATDAMGGGDVIGGGDGDTMGDATGGDAGDDASDAEAGDDVVSMCGAFPLPPGDVCCAGNYICHGNACIGQGCVHCMGACSAGLVCCTKQGSGMFQGCVTPPTLCQ
jgi:hypothetical protein